MSAKLRSNRHAMHMSTPLTSGSFMSRVLPVLSVALMLGASPVLAQSFPQTPDTGDAALASQPALTPDTQAPQLPPLAEGILVSVNNDMITSYDLKQRMLLLIVTSGVQVTQENYAAFQQQALNSLIDERLQQQELDHWKVKVTDAEVDDEIARMASQSNLKPDQLLSELKRVGVEPATLRAQIAAESGWNQLVGGRYHSSANVGTAQVDSLMDKVIADGQKPQYLVAEIFIDNTTAGSPANALQGAKQLRDQIAAKVAPFQAVARQFSNAPSAANGGDAGWLVSGNIEPSVETVLASLKPGEMSEPIVTKDGVYIYLLRQKTDGNADMVFRLKQAAVPLPANASPADVAAANAALASFRSRVDSCEAFDDLDGKAPAGVQVTDLGDAQLSTLLTNYADALRPLKNNQVTEPLRNAQNMNVLYVCDRQLAGDNALSRDQVENNLVNQRLSMLGRRYLRELRSTATIENH
ncbi:peptidylprolyl isomerase [Asticcacaulis taihuensis]|uniref:Parvulin-like PPIase n=2 Tax=Asticcacaulis taihuensis TaxID=260084 RepID=A0A1G4PEW9_9CAUL|nr:periplasmic chaperone for outer membrane proteins SurA [Asticcacaulis taihuensis]